MLRSFFYPVFGFIAFYLFSPASVVAQKPVSNEIFTVKEGLSENVVHCLFQDKKGFLWIGTHEGLNRFDGYGFKKYLHNKDDSTSLPNSPVEAITEDDHGDLYVFTSSGQARMDRTNAKFTPGRNDKKLFQFLNNTSEMVSGSFVNPANFLVDPGWYLGPEGAFENFPKALLQKNITRDKQYEAGYFDKYKQLWLLDKTQLVEVDQQGEKKIILNDHHLPGNWSGLGLLFGDSNGNLWVRTAEGIYCIDQRSGKVKTILVQSQLKELPLENVQTLLLDRSGILWVGSFYGLKKINLNYQRFRHLLNEGPTNGLASNFVLGLNIHSGNKLSVQHYFSDSLYSEVDLLSGTIQRFRIDNVLPDKFLKEVLIKNAERIDPENRKIQLQRIKQAGMNMRTFRFGYADRSGIIWSFYNGNQVINFHDNRKIKLNETAESLWDDADHLWIATTTEGLIRYHLSSGALKKYRAGNGPGQLSSDNLLCFTPDREGNLWIGTRGGGLNYFDKQKERFTHFSEENGLSSNTIYCMVMDDDQNVWMGTAKGLSCLDPRSGKFRNFYTADGLINIEFNRWSAVKDDNGVLYFGGMNGIDHFKTGDVLQAVEETTTVHLTAFRTGNELQPLQPGLVLDHKQNFISFEFVAMDFRNPAATHYRYQLQGANDEWINAENNHTAVFASLPPGKYVFKVKAATQNGIWGPEEALAFRILAPWWQRTWFYILCGLFITAVLYGIYRFRIQQLRKLYRVRSKISQDLHDEMGATLTSISFLSEVAQKQTVSGNRAAEKTINKIGEYSRDMIGEMNDIVWAINPANDKFEKIEDRIRNFAMPLLSARNIQFDLDMDQQLKYVSLDMQQRKNLYLICKEAVNNAVKYAGGDKIKVSMLRENNHVQLTITDNGKGFDESAVQAGNGLINMQQRAKEIKANISIRSEANEGTVISILMPIAQNA